MNRLQLGDVPGARRHHWHVGKAEGQVTLQHQKGNRELSLPEQPDGGREGGGELWWIGRGVLGLWGPLVLCHAIKMLI